MTVGVDKGISFDYWVVTDTLRFKKFSDDFLEDFERLRHSVANDISSLIASSDNPARTLGSVELTQLNAKLHGLNSWQPIIQRERAFRCLPGDEKTFEACVKKYSSEKLAKPSKWSKAHEKFLEE